MILSRYMILTCMYKQLTYLHYSLTNWFPLLLFFYNSETKPFDLSTIVWIKQIYRPLVLV